jgi:hypothetical protein
MKGLVISAYSGTAALKMLTSSLSESGPLQAQQYSRYRRVPDDLRAPPNRAD